MGFHFRLLNGRGVVQLQELSVRSQDGTATRILVRLDNASRGSLILAAAGRAPSGASLATAQEQRIDPPITALSVQHICPDEPVVAVATAMMSVDGHHPLQVAWKIVCQ